MFSTQSTSVMSIGAITSPDSAHTEYHLPPLCEMTGNAATAAAAATVDSPRERQTYVGHWIHNTSTDAPSDRYPTYPMMRTPSSSSLSNRSRFPSISLPSPSFSSSSSHTSDHDDEDEVHHHRHLSYQHHLHQRSRQNSLFSNFESAFGSSASNVGVGRSKSLGSKSDALATRRARNKLASAKYRAKKQALTHAMQNRIMQLATQVMNLREELAITKKSEIEIKAKYERLMQYQNSVHSPPTASMAASTMATTTRLY